MIPKVEKILELPEAEREELLARVNPGLEKMCAEQRLEWAMEHLPGRIVLSSSFGIQSALMLHMATRIAPNIPVVLVDTGYLFPETYRFIDELAGRFRLNLHVFRNPLSPAWQEARYGRLWTDPEGLKRYNRMNKVEPLERGLDSLGAKSWISGLRRHQASTRRNLPVLSVLRGRAKLHPVIDWTNRDVHRYLEKHRLPYHPLREKGYVSLGDIHSTEPLRPGMVEEETRFGGMQRECGLHSDGGGI